jgi:ABC-type Fe3+/spermidine/putrescine transport system ATPase subunit
LLSLENITARTANERTIVERVTFDVKSGEIVGLVGPSGAGKTTILRCISGLHAPSEGRINVDGQDISAIAVALRPVAYMQQAFALYDGLTVLENVLVSYGRRDAVRRSKREEAIELLRMTGIPETLFDRFPDMLSGGESQRIALCKALLREARVLLLDEPFSSLDKRRRRELGEFVRERAKKQNLSVIVVSHDELDITFFVDRVCIIQEGSIVQIGTIEELRKRPLREQVASFGVETGLQLIEINDMISSQVNRASGAGRFIAWRPDVSRLENAFFTAARAGLIQFSATFVRSVPGTGGVFMQLRLNMRDRDQFVWHFQSVHHNAIDLRNSPLTFVLDCENIFILDAAGKVQ